MTSYCLRNATWYCDVVLQDANSNFLEVKFEGIYGQVSS